MKHLLLALYSVVERRNRTLIKAARTMLIYAKAQSLMGRSSCYRMLYPKSFNRTSLSRQTPYELLHDKLPDLSFFHIFGALYYPTNDSENLGKLQLKANIGIFIGYAPRKKAFWIYNRRTRRIIETIHVDFDELTTLASEQSSLRPALHEMTPATISSGLVPNPPPSTPFVPPSRTDWDINSQTTPETQYPIIPNDVEEDNHDLDIAHINNDPLFGILIPEAPSDQSSSTDIIHIIVHPDYQISKHNSKWTKDHPLENIINQLARPVSTRLQLHEQALLCYYDAFLTSVEPKTYKDALTQSCWIEAMQEELNEFERLGVYELVPNKIELWLLLRSGSTKDFCFGFKIRGYKDFSRVYMNMAVYQIDVKTAFLNGNLREEVYVSQPNRSKHIDIGFHFVKEHLENGVIELYFVNMKYQLADIFTKALGRERIEFLINKLGMRSFTSKTLKQLADEVEV
uniref:Retroviral polymerase SH3-like domain-containing protein n=1 Tax=Tanacetum cinerariifolium TaxID=118510 RepID=A0A699J399_TANCI|nr:hypothetical protein [Tanacetum cinerariifolium]